MRNVWLEKSRDVEKEKLIKQIRGIIKREEQARRIMFVKGGN